MAQTDSDAQLLAADGKFHLLAREGDKYQDKPIEPKSDWLTYHGSDLRQSLQHARSNQYQQRPETLRGLEIPHSQFTTVAGNPTRGGRNYVHDGLE